MERIGLQIAECAVDGWMLRPMLVAGKIMSKTILLGVYGLFPANAGMDNRGRSHLPCRMAPTPSNHTMNPPDHTKLSGTHQINTETSVAKSDYYELLGCAKGTSGHEELKAYRSWRWDALHPDKNSGDKASEHKFKEINEAYDVLRDDERRARRL